jgi:hypothetical protein
VSGSDQAYCSVLEGLRDAYISAVSLWADVGGADPDMMHLPKVVAAKKHLDEVAGALLDHRSQHGC